MIDTKRKEMIPGRTWVARKIPTRASHLHLMRSSHAERLRVGNTLLGYLLRTNTLAPLPDVEGVQGEAKQIGGNEPKLRSVHRNNADQNAVETCDHPSLPTFLSHKNRRANGQDAGDIVQSKHVAVFLPANDDCCKRGIRD